MTASIDKRTRMLGYCDLASATGLEIGPLNAPLVRKTEGRVLYVDYAATDIVRANQHDPAVNPADIADIDIVWGTSKLAEALPEPADYILASHVIEHVPDLIGWLGELHAALKPGGTLGLAIPDRRFTFDIRRRESQLSEMIEAWLLGYRTPSIRQVFDVASLATNVDADAAWKQDLRDTAVPGDVLARLPAVLALARSLIETPRYLDAHCWVFTPASFLDTAELLAALQLFPYAIDAFFPTEPGSLEFQVRLSTRAAGSDPHIVERIHAARRELEQSPSEAAFQRMLTRDADQALTWAEARIKALEQHAAELRQAVAAFKASTSWQITAPLRAIASWLPGRSP